MPGAPSSGLSLQRAEQPPPRVPQTRGVWLLRSKTVRWDQGGNCVSHSQAHTEVPSHSCHPEHDPSGSMPPTLQAETLAGLPVTGQREPGRLGQGAFLTWPQFAHQQNGDNAPLENCNGEGDDMHLTTTTTINAGSTHPASTSWRLQPRQPPEALTQSWAPGPPPSGHPSQGLPSHAP